jgi:hypothetical protein
MSRDQKKRQAERGKAHRERIYSDPERHAEWKRHQSEYQAERAKVESLRQRRNEIARRIHANRMKDPARRLARAAYARAHHYGMTPAQVDDLLRQQDGRCPVCEKPSPKHVDHDHESGQVRGILHPRCNMLVGFLETCQEDVARAKRYIRSTPPVLIPAEKSKRGRTRVAAEAEHPLPEATC